MLAGGRVERHRTGRERWAAEAAAGQAEKELSVGVVGSDPPAHEQDPPVRPRSTALAASGSATTATRQIVAIVSPSRRRGAAPLDAFMFLPEIVLRGPIVPHAP